MHSQTFARHYYKLKPIIALPTSHELKETFLKDCLRLVRSFGELPKEHFITIHTLNPDKKKKKY